MVHTIPSAVVLIPLFLAAATILPLLVMARVIRMSIFRLTALAGFVVYAMGVIHVTMFPIVIVPPSMRDGSLVSRSLNLIPFANADDTSFALNVIMMLPFGFLLPLISRRVASFRSMAMTGFGVSLAIEGMQLLMLLTLGNRRIVDVDDLIANTGGAIIGYAALVAMTGLASALVTTVHKKDVPTAGRPHFETTYR